MNTIEWILAGAGVALPILLITPIIWGFITGRLYRRSMHISFTEQGDLLHRALQPNKHYYDRDDQGRRIR